MQSKVIPTQIIEKAANAIVPNLLDPNRAQETAVQALVAIDYCGLVERERRLRAFVELITSAGGPYPELNGEQIIIDAYKALREE